MNEKKFLSRMEQYHQWLADRQGKVLQEEGNNILGQAKREVERMIIG